MTEQIVIEERLRKGVNCELRVIYGEMRIEVLIHKVRVGIVRVRFDVNDREYYIQEFDDEGVFTDSNVTFLFK